MTSIRLEIENGPVLIAGPTASGKSSLALQIAETFGGQIINADALQVYACWRVLTARPDNEDLARATHRLYGHIPCDIDYSVGHWIRDVAPILKESKRPIIVGGTGLYFSALTDGLADIPKTPASVRAQADEIVAKSGFKILLDDLNDETRNRIDTQNPMRVQRAWEVWRSTGRQISDWQDKTPPALLPARNANCFVLNSPKEWLNHRISKRFDQMLRLGALEEAQANQEDWNPSRLSSKAIGASELMAYLNGDMSLDDARNKATIATNQYAKRQRTWFRSRMKNWTQIDATML